MLGLDDREYTEFRLVWLEIVGLTAREDPELYRKLMGFPNDLPNLARLHPPGATVGRKELSSRTLCKRRRPSCRKRIDGHARKRGNAAKRGHIAEAVGYRSLDRSVWA